MENEGKIAELLAEALKRPDRLIDQHDELAELDKRVKELEKVVFK